MPLIRPDAAAALHRWREVISAALCLAAGLWLASRGGWVLTGIGAILAALAAGWGFVALRRLRFARGGGAPGVVEVIEGQVAYFGPDSGGFVALRDLVEIALVGDPASEGSAWRLTPAEGPPLIVPVAAEGAERLYDAFAQLPGIDMGRIAAAPQAGTTGRLWHSAVQPALARPGQPRA